MKTQAPKPNIITIQMVKVKVKVGFLYSTAQLTR